MRNAIRIAVLCGLIVAVVFVALWRYFPDLPVDLQIQIENVQLILWPGAIFLMAAAPGSATEHVFLYGSAILLNVLLYGLMGGVLWLGLKRRIWWPAIGATLVLCLIWLRVLTL